MRRALFFLLTLGLVSQMNAQVICYVEQPAPVAGTKELNYAQAADGWTVMPDMNDPLNAVQDTLAFALGADSICCDTITNPAQINGKIAVLYRGTCNFGYKALMCQNAGARAVIIINNVGGTVTNFGMLGGTFGVTVSIPVIMITQADGASLVSAINTGNCTAFIGNKFGFFPNDIGLQTSDYILAPASSNPHRTNEVASEFSAAVGSWVFNYGQNNQTNVQLHANISYGGSSVYSQSSTAASINAGDSLWVQLPTFSQATYPAGLYKFNYSVTSATPDDFVADNIQKSYFTVSDTMFSYAAIDTTTLMPISNASYRPTGNTGEYEMCLSFRDSLADRLAVEGLYFTASTADTLSLTGLYLETTIYEWNDVFVDLNDAGLDFASLNPIVYGGYTYATDQQDVVVYAPFSSPYVLTNNQRYLFCVKTFDATVFLGFGTAIDYDEHTNYYLQPVAPINDDGTWYALGFGTDITAAIGVKMFDQTWLGDEHVTTLNNGQPAYPNPASNIVYIPITNVTGEMVVTIYDMLGNAVKTQVTNISSPGSLPINIEGVSNGQYIINLTTHEGVTQSFKILINN